MSKTCASCGAGNRDAVVFCTQCGASLGGSSDATPASGMPTVTPRVDEPRPSPPSAPTGALVLEVVEGPHAGNTFSISGPAEIGRDPSCVLLLPNDDLVSRRHARVEARAGHVVVEDLGSRNGTFVNGSMVRAQTQVRPGDRITVGSSVLTLRG